MDSYLTVNGSLLLAAMVTPALLYVGMGAVGVPILIHLLNKRRYQRVRWAAIDFLIEANRRNRRRVRIEELILLALRCLAMLLIGLMLARWFVRPEALLAMLGTTASTERIIVLDDSFSMRLRYKGAPQPDANVFDRAKAATERLVRWLQAESPEDSLTVVLMSRPDSPLHSEASIGKMDVSGFAAEIASLAPSYRSGNLPAALASVCSLLEARQSSVNAAVYVISDFQRTDWASQHAEQTVAGAAESEAKTHISRVRKGVAAELADWANKDRTLRMILVDVGVAANDNVCVAGIEPRQACMVAGVSGQYFVRVINFGQVESKPTSLQVYVGDAAQPPVAVPAIGPGESINVPVEVTFPNEGSETLTVELQPDALPIDNTRVCALEVARALRVLIVNGEASIDPYDDEVFLLTVALRPEGPQFSGNEVTVIDEDEFEETDLANFQVIIFANVYRINSDGAERLEEYVSAGGGVALFLGDQVDADAYNRVLYHNGKGILPAELGEVVTGAGDLPAARWLEPDVTHPMMQRFANADLDYFDGVVARQYFECKIATTQDTSLDPDDHLTDSRNVARVLLRFGDAPGILERSFGKGRVVLVATSADKEWNNLADRPVFVVLAIELVQYLARRDESPVDRFIGEPIRLPLDPARYQPSATLKPPTFPDEPATHIGAQPEPGAGGPVLHWNDTSKPGIYRFELTEVSGGRGLQQIAINVDSRESDLRRADRSLLLESMADLPVEYVNGDKFIEEYDTEVKRQLWPAVLIALVVVLMSEQALAWWFGSRAGTRIR